MIEKINEMLMYSDQAHYISSESLKEEKEQTRAKKQSNEKLKLQAKRTTQNT